MGGGGEGVLGLRMVVDNTTNQRARYFAEPVACYNFNECQRYDRIIHQVLGLTRAWKFVHNATVPILASTKNSLKALAMPCAKLRPAEGRAGEERPHIASRNLQRTGS